MKSITVTIRLEYDAFMHYYRYLAIISLTRWYAFFIRLVSGGHLEAQWREE